MPGQAEGPRRQYYQPSEVAHYILEEGYNNVSSGVVPVTRMGPDLRERNSRPDLLFGRRSITSSEQLIPNPQQCGFYLTFFPRIDVVVVRRIP